ncbi:hypothetical protein PC9H_007640 [Pleurotus ostreatus]|uniref:Altered inheritance of mitochondria protein 41 n=2 Tax=Pleurotus ostreatus TaxID=5322 RepID=A0A067NJ99_PLEO1|nr:uncharacterized protein PC9H_007640 [Pleurotus ostreatus]KAF7428416.1 hypothetical protein PC9H_007640 [Pleurotus ostreatus]KDQ27899.1 hypothetical protein PLEOSDRAFT_158233 [Pleurotus ostreatus PC15]
MFTTKAFTKFASVRSSLLPLRLSRANSSQSTTSEPDVRQRLLDQVKHAMKAKDTLTSTTLRSVLSEVYAADKTTGGSKIPSSTIISILRKAHHRRTESAAQFIKASREDLAAKENQEAEVLNAFLPPLLSESDIDRVLTDIITSQGQNTKLHSGQLFKAFYAQVDKSCVDPNMVKARANALLH